MSERVLDRKEVMLRLGKISRFTLAGGIKAGRYPAPFWVSPGRRGWREADLDACIRRLAGVAP